jgi:hypothetical protein
MIRNIALAAALVLGTASVALASESDPNLLNRYPAYNMTQGFTAPALQTSNVALTGGVVKSGSQIWIDRASAQTGF